MKKLLFIIGIQLMTGFSLAQDIETKPDEIHPTGLSTQQKPIPYPFIRESDIVWSTHIWKSIHLEELFNQFFYFPTDEDHRFGKKSLADILWDAMAAVEIPIYEDDELKIPIDNELFVIQYTKADTLLLEIGYDENDNEIYETVIQPKYFNGWEIYSYALRETWFIGKQDTRQDSRCIALAPIKEQSLDLPDGRKINYGLMPLFWVPMQHPAVRTLLARYAAFIDPNNMVNQPSWDWVFVNKHYNAIITRESNIYNRSISDYLTGDDALLESYNIEQKVLDIENGMWEY